MLGDLLADGVEGVLNGSPFGCAGPATHRFIVVARGAQRGPTRNYVAESAGKQPGSPTKAAKAIADAVADGARSLRLPLGADALASIRDKLAKVTADVDATESVAIATAL